MSPLGIIALIAATGAVGFVGYDIYKSATQPTGVQKIIGAAESGAKSAAAVAATGAHDVDHYLDEIYSHTIGWL